MNDDHVAQFMVDMQQAIFRLTNDFDDLHMPSGFMPNYFTLTGLVSVMNINDSWIG